jgi:hypothetical protein
MVDPRSLNALDQKKSGTAAISFLIFIAIILMSLSSILIKIDGVDAQLQTVKSKDLVIIQYIQGRS